MRFKEKQPQAAQNYNALYRYPRSERSLGVFFGSRNGNGSLNNGAQFAGHNENTNINIDGLGTTMAQSSAAASGELFPGGPLIRPGIRFKNSKEGDGWSDCSKNYQHHPSHTPGLFTVQCVCLRPILLGITVTNESESISTALNNLVCRFPTLPRVTVYDNACNFARSVRLRMPWVLAQTNMMMDRFHYRTHCCTSLYDPDTFPMCYGLQTSRAEALNRRWSTSRTHIRYLYGSNLMPFINARAVFLNLRAQVREKKK